VGELSSIEEADVAAALVAAQRNRAALVEFEHLDPVDEDVVLVAAADRLERELVERLRGQLGAA
jgi:hypothetical protein